MLKRSYQALLLEYLQYFPCVVVIGPRQCGKTTLISQLGKSWEFYDLEKQADFNQIAADPDFFFRSNPNQVVIDEAQLLARLFPALRVAIDADRTRKGRFILSGSSSPQLNTAISESLAGRVGVIEMAPLSFDEACQTSQGLTEAILANTPDSYLSLEVKNTLPDIYRYWLRGGYPEPWQEGSERFYEVWMEQYVQTYLDRDIASLFPGLDRRRFHLFLETLTSLHGTVINFSEVSRSLGVSQPTAREYFQIAHDTFLWRTIPSYEKNALKRIVKHPKGYYRDSGLLNHMLRIRDQRQLLSHPQRGHMWEALVIEEILRALNAKGIPFDYFYYRTGAGAEVDLIIEGKFGIIPIEIKQGQKIEMNSLKGLKGFIEERHLNLGLVIYNDEKVRQLTDKIIAIPFAAL